MKEFKFNIGDTVLYGDKVGVVTHVSNGPIVLATNLGKDVTVFNNNELTLISSATDTLKEYRKRLLCL